MATKPLEDDPRRFVERIDARARQAFLLALIAGAVALAPIPVASVGAAALVLLAFTIRR